MIAMVFRPGNKNKKKNGFSQMNILDKIVEHKRAEVSRNKLEISISELEKSFYFDRKVLSLKESLEKGNRTGIIAEFKRRSPSKGVINDKADVIEVTTAYTENGASALSVLTDENFFGGNDEDLIGPGVLYFATRHITAYIDISSTRIERTEDVSRFARNRFSRWKFPSWSGSVRWRRFWFCLRCLLVRRARSGTR